MAHHARRNSSPPLMPASLGGGPTVLKTAMPVAAGKFGRYVRIFGELE
ncbi:hypothetical protein ACVMB1_000120 [Bradyrhizobium sp. USDA 4504]